MTSFSFLGYYNLSSKKKQEGKYWVMLPMGYILRCFFTAITCCKQEKVSYFRIDEALIVVVILTYLKLYLNKGEIP